MRNDDIRERLKVENISERCRKARQIVWTREEMRPSIHRKKDSGDDTTWEKKKRKTEAETDGLCQLTNAVTEDEGRAGWRRIVSAAATPQSCGSG